MSLKIKHFVVFATISMLFSCKEKAYQPVHIDGKLLPVSPEIEAVDSIDAYVKPYREHIDQVLDSSLAYAPFTISKKEGTYNTPEGNLMADIVFEQTAPIFKKRTGKDLDLVLLNFGGIRAVITKGNVTARTAYEMMPFENATVVAELNGRSIRQMVSYLIEAKVPHPISGIKIVLDADGKLSSLNIQGKPFDEDRTYYVATSDYLLTGGDHMDFFKDALSVTDTDYKIRNALIDYFSKVDTIAPKVDNRFVKLPK